MENIENFVSKPVEDKKEWVAPELMKIDIEQITAHLGLLNQMNDDNSSS
jgi:hypothetical protein